MIAQGLSDRGTTEDDLLLETDVGRGGTHLDDESARLDVPLTNASVASPLYMDSKLRSLILQTGNV